MTPAAFDNALRVLLAIGGSTNAIIHLTAIAGRCGVELSLERLNRLSEETPVLVDLKPSGQHYMEDFFAAGGMPAVLRELRPVLDLDCLTVTGPDARGADRGRRPVGRPRGHPQRHRALPERGRAGGALRLAGSRAGPSSSARPRTRDCSRARAVPWCSSRWTTSRRGGRARPRRHAPRLSRPEECRTDRWARHAGGRLSPHSPEAEPGRGDRHGADLRRPDERHRLRHDRAPRGSRGGGGRAAGGGT